jgi:hypothetical protein
MDLNLETPSFKPYFHSIYLSYMTPDDIRQDIEEKVVELLKAKLEEGIITEERSQQISQVVLELLKPGMEMDNLKHAILKLDDSCPELSSLVLPYAQSYEKDVAKAAVKQVSDYIREGQYDAAVKTAEEAIR